MSTTTTEFNEQDLKPSTCIACRLRRKRCDRKQPICTSCEELNISQDLCVCPQSKLGLKSKNSKVTLDELKEKNERLQQEQEYLKSILNGELPEPDVRMKLSQILNSEQKVKKQDRNLFLTVKSGLYSCSAHFGSTSWQSLLASNPQYSQFMYQIAAVLNHARMEYDRRKHTFQGLAAGDPRLNGIRAKIVEGALGLAQVDLNQIGIDLISEIEASLPAYGTLLGLLESYFLFNKHRKIGFVMIDQEEFFNEFHQVITKDESGLVKITISLPGEEVKTSFLFLLVSMITCMTFIMNQSYGPSTSYNHLLLHEHSEVLCYYSAMLMKSLQQSPSSMIDFKVGDFKYMSQMFQGIAHFLIFERYTPHGRLIEVEDATMGHSISIKRTSGMMIGSDFYNRIDEVFKHKSLNYRRGLKSAWFFAIFVDSCEAVEVGVLPKFKPEELKIKDEDKSKYTEAILLLNETITKYLRKELKDSMEVVELISKELVPKIKAFLNKNFPSIGQVVALLKTLDLEDTSNVDTFFDLTESFLVQLLFLSLIQVLYSVCFKRLEENHRFSPLHKRFNLLSLKYSLLMFYSVPAYLECHQRVSTHKNSIVFGALPALLAIFPHLRYSFRRAALTAGLRIFEYFPVDKRTLFSSIYEKHDKPDDEILKEILEKENFQPFFSFQDLEDFQIDEDHEALLSKFSVLNNYRYLILSLGKAVIDLQNCLRSQYINLSFIRLNPSFFRVVKTCSIFLNVAYSDIQEVPTSVNPSQAQYSQMQYVDNTTEPKDRNPNDRAHLFPDPFVPPEPQPELDLRGFFNTPGLYHPGNVDELLSFVPNGGANMYSYQ
ncbi:hypothetical protein WICANDRAFT_97889 [Wickerhamomyces anomalus NRRL Y-366-8]|uniref:Zn(2)-C6 fungal-type domain-containing protein n=1 Tax=Wickerhamomyces anomalus (strain ATCC 58044 / CBS 1984 / NCYC 433 / NRRL Y-366-8) TaxID=683960 RepID=A0A1E3NVW4_WICAA|nr:uncharacterized protein WICANDRAFT_97889 [Wickerhamomyces anomalus NRRL Y-366-8]ODQ57253.1 hypothetical protein WICANDRAFT_97889 [Wickerhamomyces anomalus NRRL Y-366-8]